MAAPAVAPNTANVSALVAKFNAANTVTPPATSMQPAASTTTASPSNSNVSQLVSLYNQNAASATPSATSAQPAQSGSLFSGTMNGIGNFIGSLPYGALQALSNAGTAISNAVSPQSAQKTPFNVEKFDPFQSSAGQTVGGMLPYMTPAGDLPALGAEAIGLGKAIVPTVENGIMATAGKLGLRNAINSGAISGTLANANPNGSPLSSALLGAGAGAALGVPLGGAIGAMRAPANYAIRSAENLVTAPLNATAEGQAGAQANYAASQGMNPSLPQVFNKTNPAQFNQAIQSPEVNQSATNAINSVNNQAMQIRNAYSGGMSSAQIPQNTLQNAAARAQEISENKTANYNNVNAIANNLGINTVQAPSTQGAIDSIADEVNRLPDDRFTRSIKSYVNQNKTQPPPPPPQAPTPQPIDQILADNLPKSHADFITTLLNKSPAAGEQALSQLSPEIQNAINLARNPAPVVAPPPAIPQPRSFQDLLNRKQSIGDMADDAAKNGQGNVARLFGIIKGGIQNDLQNYASTSPELQTAFNHAEDYYAKNYIPTKNIPQMAQDGNINQFENMVKNPGNSNLVSALQPYNNEELGITESTSKSQPALNSIKAQLLNGTDNMGNFSTQEMLKNYAQLQQSSPHLFNSIVPGQPTLFNNADKASLNNLAIKSQVADKMSAGLNKFSPENTEGTNIDKVAQTVLTTPKYFLTKTLSNLVNSIHKPGNRLFADPNVTQAYFQGGIPAVKQYIYSQSQAAKIAPFIPQNVGGVVGSQIGTNQ